jgi:hypothetical protein
MKLLWNVTPEWAGETVFIVAGGPSVAAQNLDVLAGRKVIAVNSSYERVPGADVLFFGDCRWWDEHRERDALKLVLWPIGDVFSSRRRMSALRLAPAPA